jgi:hypothetical protein
MVNVVTINRPDVVALIEEAADKLTGGNKTEAVALAMRRLLEQSARAGSCSALIADRCGSTKASISSPRLSMSSPMPRRVERTRKACPGPEPIGASKPLSCPGRGAAP